MINHDPNFAFLDRFEYPKGNTPDFEWYLLSNQVEDENTIRYLIPVTFTAYYKRHGYGQVRQAIDQLQVYLNWLDKSKKWFTVIQYDDGCLNDLSHLDVKYFSMSSGRCDYPLPLICQPSPFDFGNIYKDIKVSFVGRPTHPIRDQILGMQPPHGWYIKSSPHDPKSYSAILARSVFSLCPRGYGPNSFRIQESLQQKAIPVVISDEFMEPHNIDFETYGVRIMEKDIPHLNSLLNNYNESDIDRLRERGKEIFRDFYTFDNCRKLILQNL